MKKAVIPWSVPVAVEDIPEAGLHLALEAPEALLPELAKLAGVREVSMLKATFDLARRGAGVRVVGEVRATVGQTCVATLEPIENAVNEMVDLRFAPQTAAERTETELEIDPVASKEEPPEPLINGRLDLGAIATEFLMLGIDPYPRKPGAAFATPKVEEGGAHPFAALEALKKPPGGGKS